MASETTVHNHGSEEGPGLACREYLLDGQLVGECVAPLVPARSPAASAPAGEAPTREPDDWRCEAKRSHGYCNVLNWGGFESCGACGADRPATPSALPAAGPTRDEEVRLLDEQVIPFHMDAAKHATDQQTHEWHGHTLEVLANVRRRLAATPSTPTQPGVAGDGEGEATPDEDLYIPHDDQCIPEDGCDCGSERVRRHITALRRQLAETAAERDEAWYEMNQVQPPCCECEAPEFPGTSQGYGGYLCPLHRELRDTTATLTDLRRQYEEARRLWANRVEAPTGKYPDLTDVPHYASWVRSMDAALAAAALHQGGTRDG